MIGSADLALKMLEVDNNEVVKIGGRADEMFRNLFKSKKSKNKKSKVQTHIEAMKKPISLTSGAKKAFNCLR